MLDVREGGKTPLKDVAPKIKATLVAQKSERAAQARADEVQGHAALAPRTSPRRPSASGSRRSEATFGRGDALGEAGRDPQLDETLFGLAVGGVSAPIKTAGGFAIVKVVQQIPAGVPPVAEIRERVVEAIKRERAEQQVTDKAKALVADARQGRRLRGGRQGRRLHHREHPAVLARGSAEGAGQPARRRAPGRAADPGGPGRGAGARRRAASTWSRRWSAQPAAPDGFDRERAELEKQVLEQKRALAWDNWIRGRLASAQGRGRRPARHPDPLSAGPAMDKTALLIIDAQQEYFAPIGKVVLPDGPKAVARIAETLRWARASRMPVFHIVHESRRPGAATFVPGSPALAIHDAVTPARGRAGDHQAPARRLHRTRRSRRSCAASASSG